MGTSVAEQAVAEKKKVAANRISKEDLTRFKISTLS